MISQATLDDAKELKRLVNSAYRGESSRQGWTTEADLLDGIRIDLERLTLLLTKQGSIILKYVDDQNNILGCVHLERTGEKLYLGMLAVAPPLQSKGIGKQLLEAAEKVARVLFCQSILMTVITDRIELIQWYIRHGYHITGERKPFPSDDPRFGLPKKRLEFLVMEKRM
jgi:ribosomal protein S18 acetylase RimI-like enzyme